MIYTINYLGQACLYAKKRGWVRRPPTCGVPELAFALPQYGGNNLMIAKFDGSGNFIDYRIVDNVRMESLNLFVLEGKVYYFDCQGTLKHLRDSPEEAPESNPLDLGVSQIIGDAVVLKDHTIHLLERYRSPR